MEERIIGVSRLVTSIEGLPISGGERCIEQQQDDKIRVGDERLTERDHVCTSLGQRCVRALFVKIVVGDDGSAEQTLQCMQSNAGIGLPDVSPSMICR